MINTAITVDVASPNLPVFAYAEQGDKLSRQLTVTMLEHGTSWTPPAGAVATVRYLKPDGTGGFYDHVEDNTAAVSVVGNVATVKMAQQMITVAGDVYCQLSWYTTTERVSTFCWRLIVEAAPIGDATIVSTDYWNILTTEIQSAIDAAERAEEAAESMVGLTATAETGSPINVEVTGGPGTGDPYNFDFTIPSGAPGPAPTIVSTTLSYVGQLASDFTGNPPASGWQSTIPTVTAGNYLWTKTVTDYGASGTSTSYTVARYGYNGAGDASVVSETLVLEMMGSSLTAGDVSYDSSETYSAGTVGAEFASQSTQIANLSTNKADKTALALTDRNLKYLAELTKGQAWDTEAGTSPAYQHIVASGAKAVAVDGIGGKTIVYNQLVKNGNFADRSSWGSFMGRCSLSKSNNIMTSTIVTTGATYGLVQNITQMKASHKYYCHAEVKEPYNGTFRINPTGDVVASVSTAANQWATAESIFTNKAFAEFRATVGTVSQYVVGDSFQIRNCYMIDLTQMFGSGNEPSTVTALKSILTATESYYPYNTGSLLSANVTDATSKDSDNTVLGTYTIPSAVRALSGYGMSAGSVYNEVDIAQKKFIKRVNSVDLGGLTWARDSGAGVFTATLSDAKPVAYNSIVGNLLCAIYSANSATNVYGSASTYDQCIAVNKIKTIMVSNSNYSDAASFKTAMSGVMLQYELETPTEVDISSYLTEDNVLTVEAGGTLTFTQSNTQTVNIPIPNDTVYAINLSEAT